MKSISHLIFLLFVFSTNAISTPSFAWGPQGHEVIAGLAESQLSPTAKNEINRLLSQEPDQSLISISTWADEHRTQTTAKWHFINFPKNTCSYELQRDCPDGQCAIVALDSYVKILADKKLDDVTRLNALKYIVHIYGDIHQPLHTGFSEDKGGNLYQIQVGGKPSNLHALWDTGFIQEFDLTNEKLINQITVLPLKMEKSTINPILVTAESCELVHASDFYPLQTEISNYSVKFIPILKERLSLAGYRLAHLLNVTLSK
jgi:hypothetical protein